MKVIAINDAPVVYLNNTIRRAYNKGDIFESETKDDLLLIRHPDFNIQMVVNQSNFISLDEWRYERIKKALNF